MVVEVQVEKCRRNSYVVTRDGNNGAEGELKYQKVAPDQSKLASD